MGIKRRITRATAQTLTLEDAFEAYVDEKKALNKAPATIKNIEGTYKVWTFYLERNGMSFDVKDVDEGYILSFSRHCLNEDMRATTLNHYLRDIRAFCYWCMEKCYIPKKFQIKLVTQQQTIKETYTDEEKMKLIARPSKNATFVEWRCWAVINFILATGQRAGTVCEMCLGDINYSKGEITIRKTKTNKASIIPLSKALSVALKEYTRQWRGISEDTDYLFPGIDDNKLTVNALKHSIAKYNRDRDVNRTSVHAFRHTFAKDWIRNTGDVFRLQKMLGHSTLEMTRQYVNMFNEDLKEDFDEYNPLDRLKKNASRTQAVKRTVD